MLVYIVSARGPFAEKAAGSQFYLDENEAREKAKELSTSCAPARFQAYAMMLVSKDDFLSLESAYHLLD